LGFESLGLFRISIFEFQILFSWHLGAINFLEVFLRNIQKDDALTFRRWIITGFLLCNFFRPPALWSADGQKLERLVIGYPAPVASLGIIDVMRKAGLFKKYGLDVDLVYIQGSPILTAAMVSGQVPLSFLGGAAIVASAVAPIRSTSPAESIRFTGAFFPPPMSKL
jgi:hypothetical protein